MRTLSLRGLALPIAALLALGAASGAALAGSVSAAEDPTAPFVVKIHADWCGTCTRLTPMLDALESSVGDGARFVVLDVTDKQALARSQAEAERLGIVAFFDRYKSNTGTVGILHGTSREPVSVLKGELDVAVYEEALVAARGESAS